MSFLKSMSIGSGPANASVLPRRGRDLIPRVHIEFSSASKTAAILRRGPRDWVRLLAWNTADDRISPGSWFHGRIYEEGCSVSPDGKLFAYCATKYGGPKTRGVHHTWAAISKLPWLTALALWPQSDTWSRRAKFVDDRTLIVDCPHWENLTTKDKLPNGLQCILDGLAGAPRTKTSHQLQQSRLRLMDHTALTKLGARLNTRTAHFRAMVD